MLRTTIRITVAALVVAALATSACKKKEATATAAGALAADAPQGFGPRIVWLAVRGASPEAVARALGLRDVAPSPWAEGLRSAYAGRVFVTPPIGDTGFVLAASTHLPDPGDPKHPDEATPALVRWSQALGEVQYFGTYDDIGWHAWARFANGAPVRKLAYLAADNLVIWADGAPTPEEHKLGLAYTRASLEKPPFPTEPNVYSIAGAWSVDPTTLQERHLPPSLGLLGSL